jgi:hypothetical protein
LDRRGGKMARGFPRRGAQESGRESCPYRARSGWVCRELFRTGSVALRASLPKRIAPIFFGAKLERSKPDRSLSAAAGQRRLDRGLDGGRQFGGHHIHNGKATFEQRFIRRYDIAEDELRLQRDALVVFAVNTERLGEAPRFSSR